MAISRFQIDPRLRAFSLGSLAIFIAIFIGIQPFFDLSATLAQQATLASKTKDQAGKSIPQLSNDPRIAPNNNDSPKIPGDGRLIDPNELILRSVQQSVWGPGFVCQMRQQTQLFERTMSAVGSYGQAGLGTGRLKLTMKLAVGKEVRATQQICDGRMLWTSLGPDEPFRTVNVESVRQAVEKFGRKALDRPDVALYLAIGGQSEVLRTLYMRYRWNRVWVGKLEEKPVWVLVGTLRSELPTLRSNSLNDQTMLAPLGDSVPTDVRLTLSNDSAHPLFPYMIEYYRREKSKDGSSEDLRLISTIEYFDVQPLPKDDDFFRIVLPEDFRGREDETKRYLPP